MAQAFSLQYLTAVAGFDSKSFQVGFWWTMWCDVMIFTKYLGLSLYNSSGPENRD